MTIWDLISINQKDGTINLKIDLVKIFENMSVENQDMFIQMIIERINRIDNVILEICGFYLKDTKKENEKC